MLLGSYLTIWCSNSKSKPLDVQSILKCAWRPNFTFFGIFLLFIKLVWKPLFSMLQKFNKNSGFQTSLINSKKVPKNIKFGLQAYFNINWISNGLDLLFEHRVLRYDSGRSATGSNLVTLLVLVQVQDTKMGDWKRKN